jgi:preprotein translocase subunit SecB
MSVPEAVKQLILQKIFLKDASLEVPLAPQVFTRAWQPQIDVQVGTSLQALSADQHQVLLSVTVTAKLAQEVAFLAEVHQAGIFQLKGFDDQDERQKVLATDGPDALFPFAREALADLIQRGGFPQILLQPVNFEALYQEHKARSGEAKAH